MNSKSGKTTANSTQLDNVTEILRKQYNCGVVAFAGALLRQGRNSGA
jgi:hypothetical protein